MKTFYIVPHSHLDREWYRTFQENRVKLVRFMDDLLETMEEDEGYSVYTLDAQTSFIDDYFDVKPQNKERFKKLVCSGRLPIGPWYVQPDEHLPTAEGIIRNLLISKNISDEYGDFFRLGYVPDSFGQSAAFPTLMKGFGIDSAVIYRGFAEEDSKYNDFLWEGYDGSVLVSNWMPIGYGNAMFFRENDLENNIKVIEENIELLQKRSVSDNYLLMCGSDQSFIKKFLPDVVRDLNEYYSSHGKDYHFVLSTPLEYIQAISAYTEKMETVRGELRKGKKSRTHNSIGATRMDIKKQNYEAEKQYLSLLEPLNTMCALFGSERDVDLIRRGWKYLVENHAHDSICCCCTDDIHKELIMRMNGAQQMANFLIKEKAEQLYKNIRFAEGNGRPLLLFTSCIADRKDIMEADIYVKEKSFAIFNAKNEEVPYEILTEDEFNLKDTIVSFTPIPDDIYHKLHIRIQYHTSFCGYETLYIKEGAKPSLTKISMVRDGVLDNGLVRVECQEDGTLRIQDLVHNIAYDNQHIFVDDGNAGDEYDYSPAFNDFSVTSKNALKKVRIVENKNLKATLELVYEMDIPANTSLQERSKEITKLNIVSYVSLYRDDAKVYFKTIIDNNAKNHRIQVRFDAQKALAYHYADMPLGVIERENTFTLTKISVDEGWHERYYPVFDQHRFCILKDEDKGLALLNKGITQYEIYQEDTTQLALTLLSCVGAMGNIGLKYRPGRRSGSADLTPDSQMIGKWESEYCFMFVNEDCDVVSEAYSYDNTPLAYQYPLYSCEGSLPDVLKIAESKDKVQISAYKESENGEGHILRLVNPYDYPLENIKVRINPYFYKQIEFVDLAEENIERKGITIKKDNNPDGSAKAIPNGWIHIERMERNSLLTFRLK